MNVLLTVLAAVFGLILLIVLLLLFGNVSIRIAFNGELRLIASFLGFRYTILSPEKTKKKNKKRDLSLLQNPDRILRRERKRQKKAAEKARQKRLRAQERAARKRLEKQKKKEQRENQAELTPTPNLKENLEMVLALLKKLGAALQGKFRLRVYKMHLYVATDNAADTAILYGVIVQTASILLQWIQLYAMPIHRDPDSMIIEPDYLRDKSRADIDIRCSIRPYRLVGIALKMLPAFIKEQQKAKQKALLRQKKEQLKKEKIQ